MKRLIGLLLVFTLLFNSAAASLSATSTTKNSSESRLTGLDFEDMVPSAHWSFEALTNAIDTGLMQGASGKIRPYDKMTRAEIVATILNATGLGDFNIQDLTPYQADMSGFTDMDASDWYYNQISMAYKLKLIYGFSSTEIDPTSNVTREQVFTILSRYMSLDQTDVDTSVLNRFVDSNAVSSWAKPYVAAMVSEGYVSGYNGYLKPNSTITREEFTQLMYNLFQSNYINDQESANALKNKTIKGNLVVATPGITLEDLNITGDIIIGDGIGNGNVTLDRVTITGRLIVRGGGENSIYLKNTVANTIIISKMSDGGVRLHADDGSEISYIEIPDGNDAVIIDCSVENILISANDIDVVINQTIQNIGVSGDNIHISGNGRIETVSLEKGVTRIVLDTEVTNVINHSGKDVTVVGQGGETNSVPSDGSNVDNDGENVTKYVVKLHANGGTSPNSVLFEGGAALHNLPVPQKENSIFIGWFTDNDTFENAVAEGTSVTSNMDLYAAYINSEAMTQSNEQTMTSVMDVATDYVITILSSDTNMTAADVKAAITFKTITEDEAEFAGISVNGSAGTYTLSAIEGYTTSCSYSILLNNEALSFQGENSSVRTYNLSVMLAAPVLNLQLNSAVKYIPENEISNVFQNGEATQSIFAPLYTEEEGATTDELYGTFEYSGSAQLVIGNTVAIYKGTAPDQRLANVDYTDQPISYVNVTAINGSLISYGSSDPSEIIFTPDVLPVNREDDQDGDPDNGSITIEVEDMTYSDAAFVEMGLSSSTTVDLGDFIAFYTGLLVSAENETYARINSVSKVGNYYVILYEEVEEDELFSSMDMSSSSALSYEQIDENLGIEEMELAIQQQVEESGFAQAASEYLIALAQLDETTRTQITDDLGIQDFSIMGMTDVPLASIALPIPKVIIKAKITKDLEHYSGNGLRAEVTVTATLKVNADVTLTISGTFVQEVIVKMNIKSKTIWKKKGIFPYIDDYSVSSTIDLYSYTYLAMDMNLKSVKKIGWTIDGINIRNTVKRIKSIVSPIDANDEVREFYELYQSMMEIEHAYFKLFEVNIGQFSGSIDPFCILAYSLKVDLVAGLDANASLGSELSYEKATRYSFTMRIKDKTSSNSQTDLEDVKYSFDVYALGEVGIRAGMKLTLQMGFVDVKLNSVGISAESGIYCKVWGFFNYELNHENNITTTKTGGACYIEVGMYLATNFVAQVGDGAIQYNYVIYADTWPLWTAGSQYNIYDFGYVLDENNDDIFLKGNETTYTLPSSVLNMSRMDFKTGEISSEQYEGSDFKYTIKDDPNHVFAVSDTGEVTITPPEKSDIATATLEITWNKSPLSFTSVPISRTFKLTWDNLDDSYVIRFDSNKGSKVSSRKGAYDSALALPTPTRAGYIFEGWYRDNDTFSQAFTAAKMPAANYTLYAKWSVDDAGYKVRHYKEELDGSGYTLANTDNFTDTTENSVTPAVKNYTGFQAPSTQTVVVAGDNSTVVNYYYTRKAYTLTFVLSNGSEDMVSELKYGSEIVKPSIFRSGYTFDGWHTTVVDTMPAENLSYTAQWSLETYTMVYDLDGGSVGNNPASFTINSGAFTLENPTKTHYIFDGWVGTGLSTKIKTLTIQSGATGNRYYTATWKPASDTRYSVYHYKEDLSGNYTILEVEALQGTAGSNTLAQTKSYTGFTADAVIQEVIVAEETTTVEIEYVRNAYTLTFDANGGTGGNISNVKYEANITAPSVTRTGYVFDGWDAVVLTKMPAQAVTYTAQWTAGSDVQYKVEHYQQNIADDNYTLSETENLSGSIDAAVTGTGKAYTGLTYDSNVLGSVVTGNIAEDGSLVLKLYYTRNKYTLNFDANNGVGGNTNQVKYGGTINPPTVTKTGYVFTEWSPEVAATMPNQNTTYTAQWTERLVPLGTGTLEDPYLIESYTLLKWVSENNTANTGFSEKHFKQTVDIDMSPTTLEPWIAIGNTTNKFNGSYDGNGYSVENLYINTATIRQGLFGVVGDTGTVMDLGVTSADITCSANNNATGALTGALVGTLYGSVLRCYSTGTVTGDGNTGGLIGYSYGGTIKDCYSTCTVIGNGASVAVAWDQLGGLLGKLALTTGKTGSVSNSYATGNVTAINHDQVAGLVGEIDTNQEVYSSFSTGTATGNTNVGGIIGVLQGPMHYAYTTSSTFSGNNGAVTGGSANVSLSWFETAINFTSVENWHASYQWDFVDTWAIDPNINNGLPYLKKSKLGR